MGNAAKCGAKPVGALQMNMWNALRAPLPPERVSWRVGSTNREKTKGMALAYIDARDVMERLDNVCGPDGWQCRYPHANGKTVCEIGIKTEAGEWLWKADGAGDSGIEAEKGALSDAFKRSAVRWGIGRYLYDLDSPWVELDTYQGSDGKPRVKGIKQHEYAKLANMLRGKGTPARDPVAIDPAEKNDADRQGNFLIESMRRSRTEAELKRWYDQNADTITALPDAMIETVRAAYRNAQAVVRGLATEKAA